MDFSVNTPQSKSNENEADQARFPSYPKKSCNIWQIFIDMNKQICIETLR